MSDNTTPPQPVAAKLRECPVLENIACPENGVLDKLCNKCPNRAPSPVEVELREALRIATNALTEISNHCCDNSCDNTASYAMDEMKAALAKGGAV